MVSYISKFGMSIEQANNLSTALLATATDSDPTAVPALIFIGTPAAANWQPTAFTESFWQIARLEVLWDYLLHQ